MRRSEQFGAIAAALAKAQAAYTPVPKNKTAKVKTKAGYEYTYQYADLADCLQMALPHLSANGISFLQPHEIIDGKLRVATLLAHESGEWMQSDGIEISEEGDPQQFGAESTYFRRYDGCSFIGVAPDEDTDAQQAGNRTLRTAPASAISHNAPEPDIRPRSEKGTQPSNQAPPAPPAPSQGQGEVLQPEGAITDKQRKMLYAVSKSAGLSTDQVKEALGNVGLHCSSDMIPKSRFQDALDAIDADFKFHARRP